jgi:hypothetical protein
MKHDPGDDRQILEGFFRDELRKSGAEAPSFDDLAAYVEGGLSSEERTALEERLAGDPVLRQEVDDLRELHVQMVRPRLAAVSRRRPWAFAGLAAAAAVAAVAFWLQPGPGRQPPGGDASPVPPSPTSIAVLRDGAARLVLSADGSVSGLPTQDPALRTAVVGAFHGLLPAPQGLAPLQTGRSTLMGGSEGPPAFAPQAPLGTRVATDRPTFRWGRHPQARSYEVTVYDQDLEKQAASGPVAGTEWQPARPLKPGRMYLWQVAAQTSHGRVTVPAPPEPEARFEVAARELLADVERRRSAAPGSHLVGGLVLVEAGLLDDAEVELDALAAENPGSPQVAGLRESLRALRRTGHPETTPQK